MHQTYIKDAIKSINKDYFIRLLKKWKGYNDI